MYLSTCQSSMNSTINANTPTSNRHWYAVTNATEIEIVIL